MTPPYCQANSLKSSRIAHGFFGREGGVSAGIYASLNCGPGSNDEAADVLVNREKVRESLGGDVLCSLYQIHSPNVVTVSKPWQHADAPKADAMVTNQPNIVIGVLTADCGPVLFADADAGIIGAAHAGWKGACNGVLENTLEAMVALGALRERIHAAIGPCIAQESYEVGAEMRAQFAPEAHRFFASGAAGKFQFDLGGFNESCLQACGIGGVEWLREDTYAQESRYFSYRRTTHRAEPDYGRQISAIMVKGIDQ